MNLFSDWDCMKTQEAVSCILINTAERKLELFFKKKGLKVVIYTITTQNLFAVTKKKNTHKTKQF